MQLSTSHILFAAMIVAGSFHMVTASAIPKPYSGTDITGPFRYQALSSRNLNLVEARSSGTPLYSELVRKDQLKELAKNPDKMKLTDAVAYLKLCNTEVVERAWKNIQGEMVLTNRLQHLSNFMPIVPTDTVEGVVLRCLRLEAAARQTVSNSWAEFQEILPVTQW
ncbi:hypothetical protein BC835DRAFT_1411428 [Cytidiella melzeri]|nr:hypothetical protein BC835DRAFT_1411428 [Cytidiella melzeri]